MFSAANALEVFRANIGWALAVNLPIAIAAYALGAVRGSGLVAGILFGVMIYSFGGYPAFLILLLFFVLGSVMSKVGRTRKKGEAKQRSDEDARGAGSVIGKCSLGVLLAALIAMCGGVGNLEREQRIIRILLELAFKLAYAGAFAAALADTFASELGPLFGKNAIVLTTMKPVPHGTPGGVSIPGTLFGILGALVVGLLAFALGLVRWKGILFVGASSLGASILESYLRASWPGETNLAKQIPNFFVTLTGAGGSILMAAVFGY
jgi:uncharacterized protein (TIGR00297 family)